MKTQTRPVTSLTGGITLPAQFAVCECGCDTWIIFMIVGQEHSHNQCTRCGTSYCPDGLCGQRKERAQ